MKKVTETRFYANVVEIGRISNVPVHSETLADGELNHKKYRSENEAIKKMLKQRIKICPFKKKKLIDCKQKQIWVKKKKYEKSF